MDTDRQALSALGFLSAERIGSGAEADVYAVSDDRVLRLLKPGGQLEMLESRVELLSEVRSGSMDLSFETPCVESILCVGDRCGTLERRLPGEPLTRALRQYRGRSRERLLRAWLDVSTQISDIRIDREWYGELAESDLSGYPSFYSYWIDRLDRSIRSRDPLQYAIDVEAVATAMPEPDEPRFVHLDLFGDNLLWDGESISAVLDFGFCSIMGDERLSPLFSAIYVLAFPIGDTVSDEHVVQSWLRENGLSEFLASAELMMAAYWFFANDDPELDLWCRSILDGFLRRQ